ncbi:guanosine-5'-triphosphate,3'-diphosphate pyrophosphatase GppA [Clostridium aceticum]|uniref:Exopolyphosphatase n=1 Tax=Clostridium aceticum TaxID=84022 RepID=A0A0G3W8M1_9CLOT|nr:exopolyphosphatase [Clostridium aceticum]AKL93799.1 guanosine-5'-triphosphate,3'-diphosphate pyrophosphatase GppA [Clostridium aceticum]
MNKKLAIIDLGSNSVRMIIMKIYEDASYKMIEQVKEMVRLSEGMGEERTLKALPMERTLNALKLFKRLIDVHKVDEVFPIATAAVRIARNRELFLEKVQKETGFVFDVISGEEEAYYGYMGVVNTIKFTDALMIDIGGGSTELAWIENKKLKKAVSLPYGAVTLTEMFLPKEIIESSAVKHLESFMKKQFDKVPWLKEVQGLPVVGLGGAIRTLAKVNKHMISFPLVSLHNYQITFQEVSTIYEKINHGTKADVKRIPGVKKERGDILTAGLVPIMSLMEHTEAKQLIISGNGLREGVFYKKYLDITDQNHLIADVLFHSIENLLANYDMNKKHCYHVKDLALALFDETKELHHLGQEERRLLTASALLHDIGMYIDYYNHHKHGFYLVLNSVLNGLRNRERLMCAFIVSSHREMKFREDWKNYTMLIDKNDYDIIRKLTVFLQMAEKLDRGGYGSVKDLYCTITHDKVKVRLQADHPVDLEISGAMKFEKCFEKIFHKSLDIQASIFH